MEPRQGPVTWSAAPRRHSAPSPVAWRAIWWPDQPQEKKLSRKLSKSTALKLPPCTWPNQTLQLDPEATAVSNGTAERPTRRAVPPPKPEHCKLRQ